MSETVFIDLLQKTLMVVLELSMPILMISLIVGLVISLLQAVTQIQEATLTFVPKIIVGLVTIVILGPWMLKVFITFVNELFYNINKFI